MDRYIKESEMREVIDKWQESLSPRTDLRDGVVFDTLESVNFHMDNLATADVVEVVHGEWIPCSERLPEELHMSLVTLENGKVCLGVYRPESNGWLTRMCEGEIYYTTSHKVIAWQPLPEPYKEGEKDDR